MSHSTHSSSTGRVTGVSIGSHRGPHRVLIERGGVLDLCLEVSTPGGSYDVDLTLDELDDLIGAAITMRDVVRAETRASMAAL